MRIVFFGDIIGKPGRRALEVLLPSILKQYCPDYVLANAENSAGGFGITSEIARKLHEMGIQGMTLGNHIYDQRDVDPLLDEDQLLARPANFPKGNPGRGYFILNGNAGPLAVVNLMGRTFMAPLDNPFEIGLNLVKDLSQKTKAIILDFHAEATSEKQAMGIWLDGKVSAVFGTHTHVQTADEKILPHGTGYITDVGMTGPHYSVIGMEAEGPLQTFVYGRRAKFEVATQDIRINGIFLEIDSEGICVKIERINIPFAEN